MNYSKRCRRLTYLGRHDAVQDEIRGTVTEGKQVHRLGYIEIYFNIYIYIDISNFYVEAAYLSQWVVALHEELLAKDC